MTVFLTQDVIDQAVAVVRRRRPEYGEAVGWLAKLLGEAVRQEGSVRLPAFSLSVAQTGQAFAAGRPLFTAETLPLDLAGARRLYLDLAALVEARKAAREQAEGLRKAWPQGLEAAPPLLLAALAGDRPALEAAGQELSVAPEVLYMMMCLAVRPSLRALAGAVLPQVDLEQWTQGHCPLCGSAPKLADLSGEGGRRRLHCGLCETAWFHRRLRCPFCHNDDPQELEVLTSEQEEGYRVDLCLKCGGYLKTLDLRVLAGPVVLWIDDLATWHLDLVVQSTLEKMGRGPGARTVS